MSTRGAAGIFFLDFIPNCFLVSYSCTTAYKVHSTAVKYYLNLMKHCPPLQVFKKKTFWNQRTSGSGFWKKERRKTN